MLQLYKNIKAKRNELGMTQGELAEKMGYADKSMVAKIEKGLVDLPQSKIIAAANALEVEPCALFGDDGVSDNRMPLYGRVAAGEPLEMIPDMKYIDNEYERNTDEYFALELHGDSMAPYILDGDTAIVHKQDAANSGDLVIATINGDSATCKYLRILSDGIELIPNNPAYSPFEFTAEQVEKMPVRIIGKVIETRRNYVG